MTFILYGTVQACITTTGCVYLNVNVPNLNEFGWDCAQSQARAAQTRQETTIRDVSVPANTLEIDLTHLKPVS